MFGWSFVFDSAVPRFIKDKIDSISNNLINGCLKTMTLENSRIWLNTYLPVAFYNSLK